MSMKTVNLICIGCPLGCPLTVEMEGNEVKSVAGNTCPRGDAYAKKELTNPTRITFNDVIEGLDLGSVVYPKYITSEMIIAYVRAKQNTIGSNVETLYHLFDSQAEALEFHVEKDAPVVGVPLMKLKKKDNLLIACIGRKGKIIFPRGQDAIQAGDTVIIVTTHTGFRDISDILA